jgi:multiple sugar transport system substrate-binding protein
MIFVHHKLIRFQTLRTLAVFKVFFLILFMNACSPKNTSSEKITLTWWQFWAEPYQKPIVQELIREFEKQNPNVRIEMTELTWSTGHDKIAAAFAADRAPDVLELGSDWVYEFASRNVLADVSVFADSIQPDFLGWELCRIGKSTYGFPWMLGTRAFFYNKDLARSAAPPETWNQLLDAVRKAHNPDQGIYGFGNTKREPHQLYKKLLPFFWSNHGQILSGDGKKALINSGQNVEALQFYLTLCDYGLLESQKILDDKFAEGKIGFVLSGGWLIKKIQDQNPALHYGVMLMPGVDSVQRGTSFLGGEYLVISKNSQRITAATRFIRFMMRKENAMKLCRVSKVTTPADKTGIDDPYYSDNPNDKILYQQLHYAESPPLHPRWTEIENIIEDEVEEAVYKNKSCRKALDDANVRIQNIIDGPSAN